MDVEISPEPTREERAAVLAALAAWDGAGVEASEWWEAGVREAVETEAEDG